MMKKKFVRFPDGSITEVDEDKLASAIEAGGVEYTPESGKAIARFEDASFAVVEESEYESAQGAGAVLELIGPKKKVVSASAQALPSSAVSNGKSTSASGSIELPTLTPAIKRQMKLNPFFQTPTLDRQDIQKVKQAQVEGGAIRTEEEKQQFATFFKRPAPSLKDPSGKNILDDVFRSKETELLLADNLNETTQQELAKEREMFTKRFYAGALLPEDVSAIQESNPIAYPAEFAAVPPSTVAAMINNKTKKLAEFARGVNEAGATEYAITQKALQQSIDDNRERLGMIEISSSPEAIAEAKRLRDIIDLDEGKLRFLKQDFDANVYQPRVQKLMADDIIPEIQDLYAGMSLEDIYKWERGMRMSGDETSESQIEAMKRLHSDPNFKLGDIIKYDETNHLTPESVIKLRELVTRKVNQKRDPIFEAKEHGEVGRTTTTGGGTINTGQLGQTSDLVTKTPLPINPEDAISQLINYFNYELPAKVLAEGYTNQFKKTPEGQKIAPFLDNQKRIKEVNASVKEYEAAIRSSLDAGYVTINNKYDKLFSANPEYNAVAAAWEKRVADGIISPERAQMEMVKEMKNNQTLKALIESKEQEVSKLRDTANKQREQLIIKGISGIDNVLEVDEQGRLTVKGVPREEVDSILQEYQKGYDQKILDTYKGQEDLLAKRADLINRGLADQFGTFGGAFLGGIKGAVDDLGAATSRWLYHKTGDAGAAMNYFEGERARPLNLGEYAEEHYRYKGLESLLDPAYYGFSAGQSYPYSAPGLALGIVTGGSAAGIAISSGVGATLETAENALLTRNELFLTGRDENGMKLTSQEADRLAAKQFREELLPNITFQAMELGALLRTAKYANPGLNVKTALKGVTDIGKAGLAEAAQEGIQGFVQYNVKERAAGKQEVDLFDYMQTDDFVQNFFGGFAGGVSMGAPVKPLVYAKSLSNWQKMIRESRAAFGAAASNDFANEAPFVNAMHAEMNGTSAEYRDGIFLRIANGQFKDQRERENLERTMTYSKNLSGIIEKEGIVAGNINELYAAHTTALADTYDQLAAKDNAASNKSKQYQQQARQLRDEAVKVMAGESPVYYAIDALDRPIFMSDKTAKVLANSGTLNSWRQKGYVKQVGAVNDDAFNEQMLQPVTSESPAMASELVTRALNVMSPGESRNTVEKEGGLQFLQDQALSTPSGTLGLLKGDEELLTDIISAADEDAINSSLNMYQQSLQRDGITELEINDIDRHITLLERGLLKKISNDSQNKQGVSGSVGERQESVEGQPDQGAGAQATGNSGVVQETPEEEKAVRDAAAAAGVTLSEEDVDEVTALQVASQETDTPMTPQEAVEFFEREKGNRPSYPQTVAVGSSFVSKADDSVGTITAITDAGITMDVEGVEGPVELSRAEFDEIFGDDVSEQAVPFSWDTLSKQSVEVLKEKLEEVNVDLNFEKDQIGIGRLNAQKRALNNELSKREQSEVSAGDVIRNVLKVKLAKLSGGGLQSNLLGIPVGLWNTAIETIALAVDAGVTLAEAVQRGYNIIKEKFPNKEDSAINTVLNSLVRGLEEKPVRRAEEKYGVYAMRVLAWRKKMMERGRPEQQAEALSQTQVEMDFIKKVNAGIELLKDEEGKFRDMTNEEFNRRLRLPVNDRMTYVAAIKYMRGSNKEAADKLNELRRGNPTMIAMAELDLLKKQYLDFERGYKAGQADIQADIKKIRDEVEKMLKEYNEQKLFSGVEYTSQELLRMAAYVNSAVNIKTLGNLRQMVLNLIAKADYGRKLSEARKLAKEIRKMVKAGNVLTANDNAILKDLAALNVLRVSDLDKHIDIMSDIVQSRKVEETPVRVYSNETIINHISEEKVNDITQTAKEIMDLYYEVLTDLDFIVLSQAGKVANFISEQQIQNVINGIVSDTTKTYPETMKELTAVNDALSNFYRNIKETTKLIYDSDGSVTANDVPVVDYNQVAEQTRRETEEVRKRLEEQAVATQKSIDTSDSSLSDEQKKTLETLKKLDVTGMDSNTLRLFMNVLNNVIMNNDFTGAGVFEIKAEAQNDVVKNFVQWLTGKDYTVRQKGAGKAQVRRARGALSDLKKAFTSTEQVILHIANNANSLAAKIFESVQMDRIKSGYVKTVHDLKNKVLSPLNMLLKTGLQQDVDTNVRLTIYSWLNQNKNGSQAENEAEFARRIGDIKRDIAIKEQFGKDADKEEAALIKPVYLELREKILAATGIDIDAEKVEGLTSDVLSQIDFLNDPQREAYDLFRKVYDDTRPQFEEIMEKYLNKEFVGWTNYMPDTFRKLFGGVINVDISAENFGQSIFAREAEALEDPGGAFNTRVEGNRLIEPKSGEDTRVIKYNWFDNNINNSKQMMFDVNTLKHRQVAAEVFKSKDMEDAVGKDNMEVLKETLVKELKGMTEYRGQPAARYLRAFRVAANGLGSIAAKMQLLSLAAYAKQAFSAYMNTAVFLGKDAGYMFKAIGLIDSNEGVQKLIDQNEISLRGTTQAGTNIFSEKNIAESQGRLNKTDMADKLQGFANTINGRNDLTGDEKSRMRYFLERGDVVSAKASWVALYGQWLVKNGVYNSFNEINWSKEAESPNRDAASYAQLNTSKQLNVNSRNAFGSVYTDPNAALAILKSLFGLFGNFGFNKSIAIMNNVATLASSRSTVSESQRGEEVDFAWRSLTSGFFEEVMFQFVKGVVVKLTISPLFWGLMGLLSDDEEEKQKMRDAGQRDRDYAWKSLLPNIMSNYFFSFAGSTGQSKLNEWSNDLMQYFGATKENFFFEPPDNPNVEKKEGLFSAATGGLFDDAGRLWKLMVQRTDRFGAVVKEPTRKEYILSAVAVLSNLAQMTKLQDADVNRLIQKRVRMLDVELDKRYAEEYWRDVTLDNALSEELKIGGVKRKLSDAQQRFYYQKKKERLSQLEKAKLTDDKKSQMAVDYGKVNLIKEYGLKNLEVLKEESKPKVVVDE